MMGFHQNGDRNLLHSDIQSLPTTSGLASVSEVNITTTFPHMATPEDSLVPSSLTSPLVVDSVSRPDTSEDNSYAHPLDFLRESESGRIYNGSVVTADVVLGPGSPSPLETQPRADPRNKVDDNFYPDSSGPAGPELGSAFVATAPEPRFDCLTALASQLSKTPVALVSQGDAQRQYFTVAPFPSPLLPPLYVEGRGEMGGGGLSAEGERESGKVDDIWVRVVPTFLFLTGKEEHTQNGTESGAAAMVLLTLRRGLGHEDCITAINGVEVRKDLWDGRCGSEWLQGGCHLYCSESAVQVSAHLREKPVDLTAEFPQDQQPLVTALAADVGLGIEAECEEAGMSR